MNYLTAALQAAIILVAMPSGKIFGDYNSGESTGVPSSYLEKVKN